VNYLCNWLQVSRSGYYDWRGREESNRALEDRLLTKKIVSIHQESRGIYGSPRIHESLKNEGIAVGKKRVERLMQAEGLQGRSFSVVRRQPGLKRFVAAGENLRIGLPEVSSMNQVWVGDVTYLKVKQEWLYLAVVMDLYSRRILGWSLSRTRTTQLSLTALRHALRGREPGEGLIFHTDRGIEYTAYKYRNKLEAQGMRQSLNRLGRCTDNGHMESFFHSLKTELIRGRVFKTERELRYALNSYINQFYNHQRLHSGIGYLPPAAYEKCAA
jgi:putative transposase